VRLDELAVGCRASVRAGVDAPESVIGGIGVADEGLVGEIAEGERFLARQAVRPGHEEHPGLGVQDRHVQLTGRERLAGDDGIHAVVQRGRMHVAPVQVQGVDLGAGMTAAQLAHCGGNDEAARCTVISATEAPRT
jgi:hypothetical protein